MFNFWNVHGIMNISGLYSKFCKVNVRASLTLQETEGLQVNFARDLKYS